MLTNSQFEQILKGYNPNLRLTVNNNREDMGALYTGSSFLGGVPRNYFPIENVFEGGQVKIKGLKSVARQMYMFGKQYNGANWYSKFEKLLNDFGLNDKDKYEVVKSLETH